MGTLLPILTAVFNLKSQMLGGSPSGLVLEEIVGLVLQGITTEDIVVSTEEFVEMPEDLDSDGWRRSEHGPGV